MKEPVWVLRETVEALHDRLLSEFGGLPGIRDEGMLDSALSRPPYQFAYGTTTAFSLAAAYAYGLIRNHPFIDGNKRIGFTTAILFLELNGLRFGGSEAEATIKTLALAAHELGEADYANWLEGSCQKAKSPSKRRRK